jgi:hypothetical protein
MATLHRVGSLEIGDDPRFTRRSWTWERIGWGILGLVVAGALAGALGPGPLSAASAAGRDGTLRIEYERFGRFDTESRIRLLARPGGDPAEVWLDRSYAESVDLERILPTPALVSLDGDRVAYRFPAPPAGALLDVVLEVRFRRPGRLRGRAGVPGGETVEFGQFVYP